MARTTKKPYSVGANIRWVLLVVGAPLAVVAFILERSGIIAVYEGRDFTNAFGFFIEIGVAVFIAVLLFRYSRSQQDKSTAIIKTRRCSKEDSRFESDLGATP